MANFFNFNGQTYRGGYYRNGIRVTCPDGQKFFFANEEEFEAHFPSWQPGVSAETSFCLSFLRETFINMRNRPEIQRLRIERARALGGEIVERSAGGGVGSVYVSKSKPGIVYVQIGANIKGKGRYALCAEFWTGNLIERIV